MKEQYLQYLAQYRTALAETQVRQNSSSWLPAAQFQSRYLSCIQISTPDWHDWQQSVLIFYMQVQKGTDRDPACV